MTDVATVVVVVVGAAQALVGIAVLFRVLRRVARVRHGRCAQCGYVLIEGMRARCPECGTQRPLRGRVGWTVAQVCAVVVLLAAGVFVSVLPWSIGWLTDDGERLSTRMLLRLYPYTTVEKPFGEAARDRLMTECGDGVAVNDARLLIRMAAGVHRGRAAPDAQWKLRYGDLLKALGRRYAMRDLDGTGAADLPLVPSADDYRKRGECMLLSMELEHWLPTANPVAFRITSLDRYGSILWLEEGAYVSGCGIAPEHGRYVMEVGWVDEAGGLHVIRTVERQPVVHQANNTGGHAVHRRLPYERDAAIVEEGFVFEIGRDDTLKRRLFPQAEALHASWSNVFRVRAAVEMNASDRNFMKGSCQMLQVELIDPAGVVRGVGDCHMTYGWRDSRAFVLPANITIDDTWSLHVFNADAHIDLVTPGCELMNVDFVVPAEQTE